MPHLKKRAYIENFCPLIMLNSLIKSRITRYCRPVKSNSKLEGGEVFSNLKAS
jgi:hypothetical protein